MTEIAALNVGAPRSRVDGRAKVTGQARYAAEFPAEDLLHGVVVSSGIAKGQIVAMDKDSARAVPEVVEVLTHTNRMATACRSAKFQDEVAPPGTPFRPLYDSQIVFGGQPVAVVIATSFEAARHAARLVHVTYHPDTPHTDLRASRNAAYVPRQKRSGIAPPPPPKGDAAGVLAESPIRAGGEFYQPAEFHNPMEPHATTVVWEGDGRITVHDKTQGVANTQSYIVNVFGLRPENVRVVSPFVGGAFGSGLRPQYQLYLAVMAALQLRRSVRIVLTRDQMFTFGHRPETLQTLEIGARQDGAITAMRHEAIAETSTFEDYQEAVVNWTGMVAHCDNVALNYKLAKLDRYTPADMRAPGAPTGQFAFESTLDELAWRLKIDPVELRLRNYTERDELEDKPYTSKALREAYRLGGERFGWANRAPEPRSMREGRELIGWGMATGMWEASMMQTSASARLSVDGTLEIGTATADIGTGTYTILAQIAADALRLPMESVTVRLGDTALAKAPVEGGSWTAASAGAAVQAACMRVREQLRERAGLDAGAAIDCVEALRAAGLDHIRCEAQAARDPTIEKTYSSYTHSAVFAEVRVDEELGVVRVTRVVDAICAGRILNPKTARSQIIGGVVFGIGMALFEEGLDDPRLGRFVNHNFAEYHIPVNADIRDIDVIFVDEPDDKTSPLGAKGLGEIGICGTAAAVANAIFHATGKRVRELPITLDKLL